MNPLSSKVHFLAQIRQTKRRTNRTGRTENQHERANSAPKSRACADVIQLCFVGLDSCARDFARLSAIVSEYILYLPHLHVGLIFHCFVMCMLKF